jgi:cyclophilin family peptidyl-prolyl cis-trans isomerase
MLRALSAAGGRGVRATLFSFGRIVAVMLAMIAGASAQNVRDPENTIFLDIKQGRVVIELRPDLAPKHVERIKELTRQKFYDGIVFHRVIDGFMAQTGDPTGSGRGGSGKNLPAEFSREPFTRGAVGMARAQNPNSGDSQFFIMFAPNASLNGQYTVWGRVVAGMQFVDQITRGEPPREPDKIVRMRVAADVKE